MNLLVAFAIIFVLALIVLAPMDGYARHMGSPGPSDWVAMVVVAAIVGAAVTGVVAVLWEVAKLTWWLVS